PHTVPRSVTTPPLSAPSPFFFTHPPPTQPSPLSLHDALPICAGADVREAARRHRRAGAAQFRPEGRPDGGLRGRRALRRRQGHRSEEHTSELQSHLNLVCRLLLEKKKDNKQIRITETTSRQIA